MLELLIVDGGSTSELHNIIEKYSNHISWWCSEPDSGQTNALNKGFQHTTGDIMAWLNADDALMPNTLALVAIFMTQNPHVDAVYGHRILINEEDRDIGRWILPPHNDSVLTWADFIPQETLFWRRSLWNKVGAKLDEEFHFAMDWDILLRFRDAGARMVRLPYFLGLFRIHSHQKTFAQINEVGFEEMQRLRTRCLGFSPSRFRFALGVTRYLLKAHFLNLLWRAGLIHYD